MPVNDVPAWMTCEDMLNRIKSELITEAIEVLDRAVGDKEIDIKGYIVNMPEKSNETDMKMFIINRIIENRDQIMERYRGSLDMDGNSKSDVIRSERLRKFLFSVDQICELMGYSRIIEEWMGDIGKNSNIDDLAGMIKRTVSGNDQRAEVMMYVLRSAKMKKERIITDYEREALAAAAGSAQ